MSHRSGRRIGFGSLHIGLGRMRQVAGDRSELTRISSITEDSTRFLFEGSMAAEAPPVSHLMKVSKREGGGFSSASSATVRQGHRDSALEHALSQIRKQEVTISTHTGAGLDISMKERTTMPNERQDTLNTKVVYREHSTPLSYKTQQTVARTLVTAFTASHGGLSSSSLLDAKLESKWTTASSFSDLLTSLIGGNRCHEEICEGDPILQHLVDQQQVIALLTFHGCSRLMNPLEGDTQPSAMPNQTMSRPLFLDKYLPKCLRLDATVSELLPSNTEDSVCEPSASVSSYTLNRRELYRFTNPTVGQKNVPNPMPAPAAKSASKTRGPNHAAQDPNDETFSIEEIQKALQTRFKLENPTASQGPSYASLDRSIARNSMFVTDLNGLLPHEDADEHRSDVSDHSGAANTQKLFGAAANADHNLGCVYWSLQAINHLVSNQFRTVAQYHKDAAVPEASLSIPMAQVLLDGIACLSLVLHEYRLNVRDRGLLGAESLNGSAKYDSGISGVDGDGIHFASSTYLQQLVKESSYVTKKPLFVVVDRYDDSSDLISMLQVSKEPHANQSSHASVRLVASNAVRQVMLGSQQSGSRLRTFASMCDITLATSHGLDPHHRCLGIMPLIRGLYAGDERVTHFEEPLEWLLTHMGLSFSLNSKVLYAAPQTEAFDEESSLAFIVDLLSLDAPLSFSQRVKLFDTFTAEWLSRFQGSAFKLIAILEGAIMKCGGYKVSHSINHIRALLNNISDKTVNALLKEAIVGCPSGVAKAVPFREQIRLREMLISWIVDTSKEMLQTYATPKSLNSITNRSKTPALAQHLQLQMLPHKLPPYLPITCVSVDSFAASLACLSEAVLSSCGQLANQLNNPQQPIAADSEQLVSSKLDSLTAFVALANPNGLVAACAPSEGIISLSESFSIPLGSLQPEGKQDPSAVHGCPERKRRAEVVMGSLVTAANVATVALRVMNRASSGGPATVASQTLHILDKIVGLASDIVSRWRPKETKTDKIKRKKVDTATVTRSHKFELVATEFPKVATRDLLQIALNTSSLCYGQYHENSTAPHNPIPELVHVEATSVQLKALHLFWMLFDGTSGAEQSRKTNRPPSPYIDVTIYDAKLLGGIYQQARTMRRALISRRIESLRSSAKAISSSADSSIPTVTVVTEYGYFLDELKHLCHRRLTLDAARSCGQKKDVLLSTLSPRQWILQLLSQSSQLLPNYNGQICFGNSGLIFLTVVSQKESDAANRLIECEKSNSLYLPQREMTALMAIVKLLCLTESTVLAETMREIGIGSGGSREILNQVSISVAPSTPTVAHNSIGNDKEQIKSPFTTELAPNLCSSLTQYKLAPRAILQYFSQGSPDTTVEKVRSPCDVIRSAFVSSHHYAMFAQLVESSLSSVPTESDVLSKLRRRKYSRKYTGREANLARPNNEVADSSTLLKRLAKAKISSLTRRREDERQSLCGFWSGVSISPIGGGLRFD